MIFSEGDKSYIVDWIFEKEAIRKMLGNLQSCLEVLLIGGI